MSTGLQTKLNNILTDKNENLTSSNLKHGVTCLGVTGVLSDMTDSEYNNALSLSENILGIAITPTIASEVGPVLNNILGVSDTTELGGTIPEVEIVLDDILGNVD